ncbi:molybdopterin-guanine dinucleotide biosynthesis protein MobC [Escherichia coli]|nr:molybdopterin-guanine dinucleotide biosynthesis protein MobC [Escherichia coli]EEW5074978.1 molybdopterin-guanine dinucleotide biosynthesis protein MobC [Escherichia coli]EEY2486770.1 molybdopterin-guanine dinucleotide biosynthesis protein MobC [Escherichia coli]EEZ7377515.1 molybdopterin-guanine dinucleotide biosynthesis protein MobC [Escherichia coli]EEZ7457383.1 molybdopterin-guanine dinucleotide biosynthesis protein MobC [Escherichia coli]
MAGKKFYSDEDVQVARGALADLPDLTTQRKTLRDFLEAIKDDIVLLVRTKGYTVTDIRNTLKVAGYDISEKSLRDIIRSAMPEKKNRRVARKIGTMSAQKTAE